MAFSGEQPVVRGARFFLAHAPGLVQHGFKPSLDISKNPCLLNEIAGHLRSYVDVAGYPPNRAFLGDLYPDDLRQIERPWFRTALSGNRIQPHGEVMPEEEFYGLLKLSDAFGLVWLEEDFAKEARRALLKHSLIGEADLDRLGNGEPYSAIEAQVSDHKQALPLHLGDGRLIGCINRAHEEDTTLTANVLLENLACKATATMALRILLQDEQLDRSAFEYILNCGEEAVGDPYQRGGGNMAKAIGEMCDLDNATGSDVKAFCCGPVHALMMAAALIRSGVFSQVAVVGGCSLAKLGMNFN